MKSGRVAALGNRRGRGLSPSSQLWLARQRRDPYVGAARAQGWRSRAAFKLIELDQRFSLLRPGARVVDLGAAPGSWSQVALARGADLVIGIDLLAVAELPGACFLEGDFTAEGVAERLAAILKAKADLVLSDMAPNTTGHAPTDHLRIMRLAEAAFVFAETVLAPQGGFVVKLFQGGAEQELLAALKRRFAILRYAKPKASRKESREIYLVATGFRP